MPPWTLAIRASSRLAHRCRADAIANVARGATWRLQTRRFADITPLRKQLKDEARARRATGSRASTRPDEDDERNEKWDLTVGIEIHAQLNTARKLFSDAACSINEEPNSHIAYFDLAIPGSMPIFQKATLIPALRAAIALDCEVQQVSSFDRKHYFYHDQPAGYQITQYYEPFARDGRITLQKGDGIAESDGDQVTIGIKQIQMEQDTAKSHDADEQNVLIDYNRAGQPLIEIISLPQIHSPQTAAAYVRKIQSILLAINAVTTGMEMGGLRADVNISLQPQGGAGQFQYGGISGLGQRTEIKNISTLKGVEDAIRAERDRQIGVLEGGGAVEGETRGWSLTNPTVTRRLRGKEGEVDYRYMPDPDIAPVIIGDDVVEHLRETLPLLPDQIVEKLVTDERYQLSVSDARILQQLDDGERLEYYLDVVEQLDTLARGSDAVFDGAGQLAANWTMHELGSLCTTSDQAWASSLVSSSQMAHLLLRLLSKEITGRSAKQILHKIFHGDERPVDQIIHSEGLVYRPLTETEYNQLAEKIMAQHPDQVAAIQKGQMGKMMFLVGQMMRVGEQGRIDAQEAEKVLRRRILPK